MTNYNIVSAISPLLIAILSLLSGIIGAIIGGRMAGKAIIKQTEENFNNDLEIIKQKEGNEEEAVLKAIGVEADVIIERYSSYIKPEINKIAQYDLSVIFTSIADLNSRLTNSEVFNII